jgi:hypothetical protein
MMVAPDGGHEPLWLSKVRFSADRFPAPLPASSFLLVSFSIWFVGAA